MVEDLRREAQDVFKSLPWPDSTNETYKMLDLSFLKNFNLIPEGFFLKIENSNLNGVALPLREALKTRQKIVRENLASLIPAKQGKFEALNLKSFTDGVFVYVSEGQRLENPFYGFFDFKTAFGASFFPKTLIVLAPYSQAIYVEEARGESQDSAFLDHVAELILGEGSCLTYVAINRLGPKFKNFVFESASLAPNAKLQIFHLNLGSELYHLKTQSSLWGENARFELLGSAYTCARQQASAWILSQHKAPYTKTHMLWKSALSGESKSSFLATLRIDKEAKGSEAFQGTHNLLLSQKASARPDPRLEIFSNNVKAKHASTVGYLNPEEKFYLSSRGLDEREAERLMTLGFLVEPMKYLNPFLSQVLENNLQELLYGNSKNLFN